jgi:nitrogen regulatory protein PII-like uncharacterized protein
MDKIYWDGVMDVGLEDLRILLDKCSSEFSYNAKKCAEYSGNQKTQALITTKSMNRFESVIACLISDLNDIFYFEIDDIDGDSIGNSLSLKMKDWIMLGSAIEATLQIFLSIYITDYESTNWKQWINFNIDNAKKPIFNIIDDLISKNVLENSQGRSLKESIKEKIKEHTNQLPVDRVMLDDLIVFFDKNGIVDADDVCILRTIQSNRNCVHAYSDRFIGTFADLKYCIRFFCYLMECFTSRFPDTSYVDLYQD